MLKPIKNIFLMSLLSVALGISVTAFASPLQKTANLSLAYYDPSGNNYDVTYSVSKYAQGDGVWIIHHGEIKSPVQTTEKNAGKLVDAGSLKAILFNAGTGSMTISVDVCMRAPSLASSCKDEFTLPVKLTIDGDIFKTATAPTTISKSYCETVLVPSSVPTTPSQLTIDCTYVG